MIPNIIWNSFTGRQSVLHGMSDNGSPEVVNIVSKDDNTPSLLSIFIITLQNVDLLNISIYTGLKS